MNILIISDAWHPQINGVVMTYVHLEQNLKQMGHNVRVVGPEEFSWKIPMPGYSEIKLVLSASSQLDKKVEKFSPDHIHIATEGPLGWAARKYCRKHKLSFTTSYHTHFPDYAYKRFEWAGSRIAQFAENITKKWVKSFHAPSSAIMISTPSLEETLKNWGFKNNMERLIRGVDLDLFYVGDKTLFKDLPKPIALYVGRVAIEKNLEDFLSMDWKGSKIIVGDGPSLEYLKQKYPNDHFMGKKTGEELAQCYRSSDVFVFPSRTDTFGIVIIEALASGLPVVGYDVTGPKDIITESFLGILAKDNDLGKATLEALRCGSPDQRMHHVKTTYTWENATQQFLKTINKK